MPLTPGVCSDPFYFVISNICMYLLLAYTCFASAAQTVSERDRNSRSNKAHRTGATAAAAATTSFSSFLFSASFFATRSYS